MDLFEEAIHSKRGEMEETYRNQIEEFEVSWGQRIEEYDRDVEEAQAKQQENLEEEQDRYEMELQQKLKASNKMSSKYLALKKRLEGLSKALKFEEAAEVKEQLEEVDGNLQLVIGPEVERKRIRTII